MKVKATLEFIHPYGEGKFQAGCFYEVPDNDGNKTLLKIGYFKIAGEENLEVKVKPKRESGIVPPIELEEKESKEVVETKEYKGKKKTK